ncbi:hypothetical protein Q8F57_021940 [Paraburkholderia terrae]|nr:hypothetical protein [Paraburkholderia terrae]MDW3657591.1 hypothetical protein [Paraburkholderia terrae]
MESIKSNERAARLVEVAGVCIPHTPFAIAATEAAHASLSALIQ